jgi:transcriptional regulator with XRE-family HTH domain
LEILSTGEKIRRARIYKGYTLKDICCEKMSISKMSCIENDKVDAEDWILEHVAKKLELDIDYLKQDIKEQLIQNLNGLEKSRNDEGFEEKTLYNLGFGEKYECYDICFKLIHLLFNYYLDNREVEKLQTITSKYYEFCQKSYDDENYLTYYMDMARYLFSTKEFLQAANYYNNVRKSAKEKAKKSILAKATYNEAACYIMLRNNERAYEIAVRLEELVDYLDGDLKKAEVYQMLAILSLSMDKGKFEEYEKKSYELYRFNLEYKALAVYNYAATMFDMNFNEKALEYIKNALQLYPKDNKEKLVRFMLLAVDELIDNNVLEYTQSICDETLDYAIGLNDVKFIERAYYFKSRILQKAKNLISAEMYMNLSLDSLLRFGSKQEVYRRYMEMGYMYYNLEQVSEAIKYFNLAIALEKKM